jgi:hypothetical protein
MLTIMLPTNAGDGATEATWLWHDVEAESCWQQCCRILLVTTLPGQLGHGAM